MSWVSVRQADRHGVLCLFEALISSLRKLEKLEIRNRLDHERGLVFGNNDVTLDTTSWVAG